MKTIPSVIEPSWVVRTRIVIPLKDFGLLECRYMEDRDREVEAVRKTKLLDRFMSVEW